MVYLDVLIGFSLIMLVFASGVSVLQTFFKRLFMIKGAAISAPLADEIEKACQRRAMARGDIDKMKQILAGAMGVRGSAAGKLLRYAPMTQVLAVLSKVDASGHEEQWKGAVDDLNKDWDRVTARLSASYEKRTRLWVTAISFGVVLFFNVDAVRMLQILSVSPETRNNLVAAAEQIEEKGKPQAEEQPSSSNKASPKATLAALDDWQKSNLAALSGAGLPLGWSKATLYVVRSGGTIQGCTHASCSGGEVAPAPTFWLWLYRILGLVIGAGLIAQGAPFWYSVLDTVVGLKNKAQTPIDVGGTKVDLQATAKELDVELNELKKARVSVLAEAEAWSKALAARGALPGGGGPEGAPKPPAAAAT